MNIIPAYRPHNRAILSYNTTSDLRALNMSKNTNVVKVMVVSRVLKTSLDSDQYTYSVPDTINVAAVSTLMIRERVMMGAWWGWSYWLKYYGVYT